MDLSTHLPAVAIAATLSAGAAAGCDSGEPPVSATLRDSAGVEIVEHDGPGAGLAEWRLSEEPEAVIGARAEVDPAHQFTEVRGAIRLSDGRIVVGDWGTKEARFFDAAGRHLATVGGGGVGPGEVRFLFSVDRVRGDTVVVGGWPIGSRYWFDEEGAFVRDQILGPWYPGMLGRTLPDGSLVLDTYDFGSYGNTIENWVANGPDEDIRPAGVVELVSADGAEADTLGTIMGEWHHKTGALPGSFAAHALPFSPIGLVAWSDEHVFIGHTERPEVLVYGMGGSLERIIRWTVDPVPVASGDRDAFRDEVMANMRNPAQAPAFRRWLSEISYPDTRPSFAAMIANEEGFLWVRPSVPVGDESVAWTVYGPDGRAQATATLPSELEVLDVDRTHIVARWEGEYGVEYVGSYRVER